jgi:hypothetical protein
VTAVPLQKYQSPAQYSLSGHIELILHYQAKTVSSSLFRYYNGKVERLVGLMRFVH